MIAVFAFSFIGLLCISAPITVALGGSAMAYALISGNVPITTLIQTTFGGLATFPLLAIPLFMLAGNLMNEGGITPDLVRFARLLLGHIKGGLGLATILACAIFSAISESAPWDDETVELVEGLRGATIPAALKGTEASAYVGGQTAGYIDLATQIGDQLPRMIAIVVALSFVVLLIAFRSLLIPVKAAAMNLL